MVTIREEKIADVAAREVLLDEAYGAARFAKTSERLREGRLPADGLSLVAVDRGRIVGTVRLWNVTAGPGRDAVVARPARGASGASQSRHRLGADRPCHRSRPARRAPGDRAGRRRPLLRPVWLFRRRRPAICGCPARSSAQRLLALELKPGALDGARGMIGAAGRLVPAPDLATLVAQDRRAERARARRARAA